MAKEFFKNLPDTSTPLRAERINGLLDGEEAMGSIVVDDINGKNLFDKGSMVAGDRINAQTTIRLSSRQGLYLEPGTYTFSTNLDTSVYRYEVNVISSPAPVSSYDTLYGSGWKTTSTLTFTVDNNTKGYFNLGIARINNSSLTLNDISSANIQLEKGSTSTEYTEYKQPVKRKSYGVKEDATFYANDFKSKNLFIPTKTNNGTNIALYQATLNMEDDEFVFTATGTAIYFGNIKNTGDNYADDRGILIDVEGISSISYTLTNPLFNQTYITRYDSSKKSLGYVFRALSSGSYDIPAGTKYITLRFGINNTTSGTTYRTKVQLEAGSEPTPYTPYKEISVEDTGWVDLSSYVNTTNFTIRPGFNPQARKIGNMVFFKGAVYCTTAPNSNITNLLTNIPNQFRPSQEIASAGARYGSTTLFRIWYEEGNIKIQEASNIPTTQYYQGYALSSLVPYLVN